MAEKPQRVSNFHEQQNTIRTIRSQDAANNSGRPPHYKLIRVLHVRDATGQSPVYRTTATVIR